MELSLNSWMQIAERLGVSVALLTAVGIGVWYFGRRVVSMGERLTDRHIKFLDETNKVQSQQAITLADLSHLQRSQDERLQKIEGLHEQHAEALRIVADTQREILKKTFRNED